MSINPKSGKKCWSCKYCEDVGHQNDSDTTYYRKCTNPSKEYIDKCVSNCSSYVWDGKTPENSEFSSGLDSSPLGCLIGFGVIGALVLSIGVGCSSMFGDKKNSKKKTQENDISVVSEASSDDISETDDFIDASSNILETLDPSIQRPHSFYSSPINATVTAEKLNVRAQPNSNANTNIISGLVLGNSVKVLAEESGWAFIEFGGKYGWCGSKHLEFAQ